MRHVVIAALLLSSGVPAAAVEARDDADRREVSYADLDLRRPGDVERLERRVRVAARGLCGDWRGAAAYQAHRSCMARSLQGANRAIETAVAGARAGDVQTASLPVVAR